LLIGIAVLGAIGATYAFWPRQETYAEWYRAHLTQAKGAEFRHPYFRKAYAPTSEEQAEFAKRLPPVELQDARYFQDRLFNALSIDDIALSQYANHNKQAIEELFKHIGTSENRSVFCRKLAADTAISFVSDKEIPIYFVEEMRHEYGISFRVPGKEEPSSISHVKNVAFGEIVRENSVPFSNDGFTVKPHGSPVIVVSVGKNAVQSYATPLAETLHAIISPASHNYVQHALNQLWTRNGKPTEISRAWIKDVLNEHELHEEGVVHALIDDFVEKNGAPLGFNKEEIDKYVSHGPRITGQERYAAAMREKISHFGSKGLWEAYQTRPHTLFQ